jgi:aminoglycoside 6'-N-acetyltransferase I
MKIIDLSPDNEPMIRQAAALLVESFPEDWPDSWTDMESGLKEVHKMLAEDRICRAALDDDGAVLGWIGGIPEYDGYVWELHPLVVRKDRRGQGIGRALVNDLEELVRQRGALTLMLGSDDITNMTTLGGIDLYTNTWEHIQQIQNLRRHPYTFYQKLGFTIIGVMPDANGPGKPDIYMAKRIQK